MHDANINRIGCFVLLTGLMAIVQAPAADWPAYGADAGRRHLTDESVAFPLHAAWHYTPAQPPSPAWPEPGLEMHRVDFDYAFQPVIAGGLVYGASSADDTVRALDLATGAVRWRFTAGAPVRFAPHLAQGRCYVASDDGLVYCLEATTGKLVWQRRVALDERQVLGNGRMISRGPCRAGVLVADGVVYVAAGMWPSEGVTVYALDARDGHELWCNDTSGGMFLLYPHGGAYAIGGVAPQGYLAASADLLLVPTGRSVPAAFERATGRLRYYRAAQTYDGGWRITLAGSPFPTDKVPDGPRGRGPSTNQSDGGITPVPLPAGSPMAGNGTDSFYCPTHAHKWPMSVPQEKYGPRAGDGLRRFTMADGESDTNDVLPEQHLIVPAGEVAYLAGNGAIQARRTEQPLWTAAHGRAFALACASNAVLVGGSNSVSAFDRATGAALWRSETDGEARGLAIADGRVVVATHRGTLVCFAPGTEAQKRSAGDGLTPGRSSPSPDRGDGAPAPEPHATDADAALRGIDLTRLTRGYALVVGAAQTALVERLVKHTEMHVLLLDPDPARVEAVRSHFLDRTALYGSRVSAQHLAREDALPYPDYFANLVVAAGPTSAVSGTELYRVLRPCGGILCFPGMEANAVTALLAHAAVPAGEIRGTDVTHPDTHTGTPRVVRGKLPGAFDWNSEVTSDTRLKWPLELAWFGGPGPAHQINRHGAVLPVAANGRYFVVGSDCLIAVDAYNGCELWSRTVTGLVWNVGPIAADDETVYVHFRDACQALDAQTGRPLATYRRDATNTADTANRPWSDLPAYARTPVPTPQPAGTQTRANPLTGEQEIQTYLRAHGCGSFISSATMHFFRSATYGMYDLEDDSGLRNFSGARPSCALSMLPALGLLIANEGSGGCVCSYNFQSSFALAPAHQRRNEDWAVFYDAPAFGLTRRLALNLGAPGDRRDEDGQLWLGMARPTTGLPLACELDIAAGLGAERVNADRIPIEGTPRPWIYSSALVGLRRLTLNLEHFGNTLSLATPQPPVLDGMLKDACWDRQFPLPITNQPATVFLRHDATNLYLAYRRPIEIGRRGETSPWHAAVTGADATVWTDDSCELTLSDARAETAVHLGLSASGARYDGLWTYADPYPPFDIPRLDGIRIDGRPDDWGDRGFLVDGLTDAQGFMRAPGNLSPSFRLGWDERGVLLFLQVRDNQVVEYPAQAAMWQKDSLELFMAESRESRNRFQMCVGPGADGLQPKARAFFWDKRVRFPSPLTAEAAGARTTDGYTIELLLPWSNLDLRPEIGREVALQLMVNDADATRPAGGDWFRVLWHPDGSTAFKPRALHLLRLADKPSPPVVKERLTPPDKRGLARSGVRLDIPTLAIPNIEGIAVDGDLDDWREAGFQQQTLAAQDGTLRAPDNFDPSFRLGWDADGLLLAARVRDQTIITDSDAALLWRKDSIETFLTTRRGGADGWHVTLAPSADAASDRPALFVEGTGVWAGKTNQSPPLARARRMPGGYTLEARFPWSLVDLKPALSNELAVQLFFNDADDAGPYPGDWFRAAWYPRGHAGWDPLAYHVVRLAGEPTPPAHFERGERVNDTLVRAAAPTPWPLPDAILGKMGEDRQWDGPWRGAVKTDETAFVCELAVPWKMVEQAGLQRDGLTVDFSRRGPLTERPSWSFVPVDWRETSASPARPYTVRLHFAELRDVPPGQRVFDVRLQGQCVATNLDVTRQAGGPRKALTLEFPGIMAATQLTLELTPQTPQLNWTNAPLLNGLELIAEP